MQLRNFRVTQTQLQLIVFIDFKHGKVFVKYLVDHKTYDQICKQFRH